MTTKDYRQTARAIRDQRVGMRMDISRGYSHLAIQARLRGDHALAVAHVMAAMNWAWKGAVCHFEPFGPLLEQKFKRGGITSNHIGAEPIIPRNR